MYTSFLFVQSMTRQPAAVTAALLPESDAEDGPHASNGASHSSLFCLALVAGIRTLAFVGRWFLPTALSGCSILGADGFARLSRWQFWPLFPCSLCPPQKKVVKADLAKLGATLRESFSLNCTHLITADVAEYTMKVRAPLRTQMAAVSEFDVMCNMMLRQIVRVPLSAAFASPLRLLQSTQT